MAQLEESPYGESRVIIWNDVYFVVLHSWAELSERSGSTRLENISLYPCLVCDRMPDHSNLDRDFVAGTRYWIFGGEDHNQYAIYCRPCAAKLVPECGYTRAQERSMD